MSDAQKGEKHWNYGNHLPEEQKTKISKALKGVKKSEETRKRMKEAQKGETHWNYGRNLVQEGILKTGKQVYCIETQKVYCSASQASRETGISTSAILNVCKGNINSAKGFHWEFANEKDKKNSNIFVNKTIKKS